MKEIVNKIMRKLMRLRLQPIHVYCFHHVSDYFDTTYMWEKDWTDLDILKQFLLLQQEQVTFITLHEAQEMLKHDLFRFRKYAVLTADDGFKSLLNVIPWLIDKKIPITLFINPQYVFEDTIGPNVQERLELMNTQKSSDDIYLKYKDILALNSRLISFGYHGYAHLDEAVIDTATFKDNIIRCMEAMRDTIPNVTAFYAHPHGRTKPHNDEILGKLGIVPVYISGTANYKNLHYIDRELLSNEKLLKRGEVISKAALKNILLQLLDKFVKVCEENHLQYYLAYGSVLGAIRHGGMIPWDDDIDVYMPREDYEKLQCLSPSEWSEYELTSWRFTRNNQYHFLKLEDPQTTIIEQFNSLYVGGVYIDIFPLDKAPNDESILVSQLQEISKLETMYDILSIKQACNVHGLKNYVTYIIRHRKYAKYGIQNKWEEVACKYRKSDSDLYFNYHQAADWNNTPMPIDWFGKGKDVEFEGRKYIVPSNYDAYLTQIYGDYMTPPPEDKRGGHEYLYVNLNERIKGKHLKQVVREINKKVSFKFSLQDEFNYWKQKLKI